MRLQYMIFFALIMGILLEARGQSDATEIPQSWITELSNYRASLLNKNPASLEELRMLFSRWDSLGASKQEQVDFTFNVLKVSVVDGWSFNFIKKKAQRHHPGIIADSLTKDELRIISAHPHLLDLVFLEVLEWEYPFKINTKAEFFEEIAMYQINESDKIGEIGSGTGVFSLLIKLFHPDVELYTNELDRDFVKYITTKLESGIGNLEANQTRVVKGSRQSTGLEGTELDKVIIRNTLHHFKHQDEMLASVTQSLRSGGELFIWESLRELDTDGNICRLALSRAEIRNIFANSNFQLLEEKDFSQSVLFKLRKK